MSPGTIETPRSALGGDLRRAGVLVGDARIVGRARGSTWFAKDLVLTRPDLLVRCVRELAPLLPDGIDRLAAAGAGATALAAVLAVDTGIGLVLGEAGDAFVGDAFPGAGVALVVDVLLTGGTARRQVAALRATGLSPRIVLALLDRQQGASAALEAEGVPVRSCFTDEELLAR
jgi:orotate phosphoribosyltransferase